MQCWSPGCYRILPKWQEEWPGPWETARIPLSVLLQGQRGQRGGGGGRDSKETGGGGWDPFPLSQGTAAVSAKVEICKWQAGFSLFPEQQQLSQNKHSQKLEHEALKPPPRHTCSHIYTHHNSCYLKAVITTASWLSISVYLWCITHFIAILIQRLSCHCSVFGWEKKHPKRQTAVGCPLGTKDEWTFSTYQGAGIWNYK